MWSFRRNLPVFALRDALLRALRDGNSDAAVVCGETGSGKTTQVPQYLLDDAIERGEGRWDGRAWQAASTGARIDDSWDEFRFDQDFSDAPALFSSLATYAGADPAALRFQGLDAEGVQLRVMEETSRDAETAHLPESVDVFAIEGSGLLSASPWGEIA